MPKPLEQLPLFDYMDSIAKPPAISGADAFKKCVENRPDALSVLKNEKGEALSLNDVKMQQLESVFDLKNGQGEDRLRFAQARFDKDYKSLLDKFNAKPRPSDFKYFHIIDEIVEYKRRGVEAIKQIQKTEVDNLKALTRTSGFTATEGKVLQENLAAQHKKQLDEFTATLDKAIDEQVNHLIQENTRISVLCEAEAQKDEALNKKIKELRDQSALENTTVGQQVDSSCFLGVELDKIDGLKAPNSKIILQGSTLMSSSHPAANFLLSLIPIVGNLADKGEPSLQDIELLVDRIISEKGFEKGITFTVSDTKTRLQANKLAKLCFEAAVRKGFDPEKVNIFIPGEEKDKAEPVLVCGVDTTKGKDAGRLPPASLFPGEEKKLAKIIKAGKTHLDKVKSAIRNYYALPAATSAAQSNTSMFRIRQAQTLGGRGSSQQSSRTNSPPPSPLPSPRSR